MKPGFAGAFGLGRRLRSAGGSREVVLVDDDPGQFGRPGLGPLAEIMLLGLASERGQYAHHETRQAWEAGPWEELPPTSGPSG